MSERVVALWRYPVKSMGGEQVAELAVDARGVVGDRRFAVRTERGKLGSGKSTQRFERVDGLLGFSARFIDRDEVEIELPDGRRIRTGDPDVQAILSDAIGQPIELVEERADSHLDAAAIHLVTRATLDWVRRTGTQPDERRLRPNLVTDGIAEASAGTELRIAETLLRITVPTERCVMVGLAQPDLPAAPGLLRAIAEERSGCAGMYAEVVHPGIIGRGALIEPV
ncbi:MAG TPA: MOSC N-terminal beta barrel domain-containing protein [Kofleriaceae bacterium]|nr:MOSC N-terminal beta barrel domain-containing protein [Kofleriaceae bacterium]